MAEKCTITVSGMKLQALAWGPPDGHLVLALHGWLDNAASFVPLAPFFSEQRFVALDLPGHGRSDWRPDGVAYHFVDWVPDILEVADKLGAERFSLVGHSMGAGIATLVAGVAPHRIERLLLIEGLGPLTEDPQDGPEGMEKAIRDRKGKHRKLTVFSDLETAVKRIGEARGKMSSQGARLLAIRGTRKTRRGFELRHDPRLQERSMLRMTEEQVLAFIERIDCPTLLIRASEGYPFVREKIQGRIQALSRCRVEELVGGHHIHLDHADRLAAVLEPFWPSL